MIGQTLGHYRITGKLGAGGMGEVYRAADTVLGRDVAIKVLPPAFARDPERLARFEREARVLASLNHPNIAAIYGLEQAGQEGDPRPFLVLELAPGEILKGPLPVEESLAIARQITHGLEAAHEKGIVHRDLKPANIKITPEGKVKILDFGLAKAFSEEPQATDPSLSPTLSAAAATRAGAILGTAAYMSPEQARGKPIDKRTDLWAFGCVLYETLTGKQTFRAETVSDSIAAVLAREPDWSALPADTPANIRLLLRRCLEKDAARRLRDAADARLEIEQPAAPAVVAAPPRQARWRQALPWVLTGVLTGVLGALAGFLGWQQMRGPRAAAQPSVHLIMAPPKGITFSIGGGRLPLAISPDGARIVFTGTNKGVTQLYRRELGRTDVEPISGTQGALNPFFSPDGQWIGFFQDSKLKKTPVRGGPVVTLCDAPAAFGGSWGPDDSIVFSASFGTGLSRVPSAGGKPEALTTLNKGDVGHRFPVVLPGGEGVLYVNFFSGSFEIWALSLRTGERRKLTEGTFAQFSPTGHLVFVREGTLMAAPMDPGSLRLTGTPLPLIESVARASTGAGYFHFSGNGTLVYLRGAGVQQRLLAWATRQGAGRVIPAPMRAYDQPRLSPDGKKVAVAMRGPDDVWVFDLERGASTRLTFDPEENETPLWSPDGRRIAFTHSTAGSRILWKSADGSGKEETLLAVENHVHLSSWSGDGKLLAYSELDSKTNWDIWLLPLAGHAATDERKARPFLRTPAIEFAGSFSPDGRWLAYVSNETGRFEIFVRPADDPSGGKWQISDEGGGEPRWAPNGRELFYRHEGKVMAVSVQTTPAFQTGKPQLLFESQHYGGSLIFHTYDVSPNGREFLMLQESEELSTQLQVVLNWFEELRQRVGTAGK